MDGKEEQVPDFNPKETSNITIVRRFRAQYPKVILGVSGALDGQYVGNF